MEQARQRYGRRVVNDDRVFPADLGPATLPQELARRRDQGKYNQVGGSIELFLTRVCRGY
jgi:hypothetical protein